MVPNTEAMNAVAWIKLFGATLLAGFVAGFACIPFYYLLVSEAFCGASFFDVSSTCSQSSRTQDSLLVLAVIGIFVTTFFAFKIVLRRVGHRAISYPRLLQLLLVHLFALYALVAPFTISEPLPS